MLTSIFVVVFPVVLAFIEAHYVPVPSNFGRHIFNHQQQSEDQLSLVKSKFLWNLSEESAMMDCQETENTQVFGSGICQFQAFTSWM